MKIIFYCQYVLGMGHFFRSLEIARALSDNEVTLVVGGQAVDVDLPGSVRLVRLPALYMDEHFTRLISGVPAKSVKTVQQERKEILYPLFEDIRPDLFLVELYPFGRSIFQFELDPLLEAVGNQGFGRTKSVCSLRDVLVEKRDPVKYEKRVLDKLNRYFHMLLIHSDGGFLPLDETFRRVEDIRLPLHYTGFVARKPDAVKAEELKAELSLSPNERLIVASAGGGRTGYPLLRSTLKACNTLVESHRIRLEVFAGPFMDDSLFNKLSAFSREGVSVRRFTRRLLNYLDIADLSISMAGYNTCMDLMVTRVPALVYPYARQQEQPLRAEKINRLLPMKVLKDDDLHPDIIRGHIHEMLSRNRPEGRLNLNMNGAENTARILSAAHRAGV